MKEEFKKIFFIAGAVIITGAVFIFASQSFSYDTSVAHPFLAQNSVALFNQNSPNPLTKQEAGWISQGAVEEDTPTRWMNHFYNPNTGFGLLGFAPANVWANSSLAQSTYLMGDQTWQTAILAYNNGDKKRAFIALGHVLHLIEDMTVPAHTRIDMHPEGDPYEDWVKVNTNQRLNITNQVIFNNLNDYFNSLANYSNKHFFSKDTINTEEVEKFNVKEIEEVYKDNKIRRYGEITDLGNKNYKLIRIEKSFSSKKYSVDDYVHSDYYSLLAPKAISYGAGVIDLFFRQAEAEKNKKLTIAEQLKQTFSKVSGILISGFTNLFVAYQTTVTNYSNSLSNNNISTSAGQVLSTFEQAGSAQEIFKPEPAKAENTTPLAPLVRGEEQIPLTPFVKGGEIQPPLPPLPPQKHGGQERPNPPLQGGQEIPLTPFVKGGNTVPTFIFVAGDSLPPKTIITSGPNQITNFNFADFIFTSSESNSTFDCDLNDAGWQGCSSPKNLINLTDSSHIFKVRARDASNNIDQTPAEHGWTVDTTAPQITITNNPANFASSTAASFAFSSNESGATFACSLDSNGWPVCLSPKNYSDLSQGEHNFKVKAQDGAGNISTTTTEFNWTIDLIEPQITILSGPPDVASSTTANFQFVSSENDTAYQCQLDANPWQLCSASTSVVSLIEGQHSLEVKGLDQAGNISSSTIKTWLVDMTAAQITITNNPANFASSTAASFAFSSNESGATFACSLDSNGWPVCLSPKNYSDLSQGEHNFKVKAQDGAGNISTTTTEFNWTIDLTEPQITILSGPPDVASSTTANFQFVSSENDTAYQCQLDANPWQTCSASTTAADLMEGDHSLLIKGADLAGNIGSSTIKTWLVDMTAPASTVASLAATYAATGFIVGWSGIDADAAGATSTARGVTSYDVQYKIGAGEWQSWLTATTATSTVFNLAMESGQTVYFRSRARDFAGNLEDWPAGADTGTEISPKHLVISQLQIGGASTEDEFIELYNPADADIDLSGYSIQYRGPNALSFGKKNFLSDSVIKAKGYFLIAHTSYTGNAAADLVYSGFVMAAGGGTVFLVNSHDPLTDSTATSSIVADRLAYGAGSYLFPEGAAYASAPAAKKSLVRKAFADSTVESMAAGGAQENSGNSYDSDDNSADFVLRAVPKPRSSHIYDIVRDDLDAPTNFGRDYMFTDFKPGSSSLSGVAIKTTTSRAAGSFKVTICKGVITRDNYTTKADCGADILIAQKTCDITNNWIWNAWQNCDFDNSITLVPNDNYYVVISGNTWVGTSYSDTDYGVNVACGFNNREVSSPYCFDSQYKPFLSLEIYSR